MSPMSIDERRWVERARAGDRAAFEAIVARYERQIYAFVYRMLGDADDACDLTQDCFVKAYQALPRIRRELNVSAWLHRIAANACLDVLRRRQRLRWLPWHGPTHDPLVLSGPADDPEHRALSQEARVSVQHVLDQLKPRHRLALILREVDGLSCQEIGAVMGMSPAAVKSTLYRARLEFRHRWAALERQSCAQPAA
ncbi:MAG: sigma-70 family RNA polymerase sigma factor [Chloroflexi bacterium]|nr:sigma-70 family RNA polymerase sigma factor [Chloroflexota bacterium]